MHYGTIKPYDIADGPGVRVALYVSGCRIHCEGCHNPESQNFGFGKEFTSETETEILSALDHPYITGFSLLGGEPFEEENQAALVDFLRRIKERFPEKDIWAYTGYTLPDLKPGGRKHTAVTDRMLSYIDVLVDGPFILDQKNISLAFRGSENQRIIHEPGNAEK